MFLLIQEIINYEHEVDSNFTFHNVSINTEPVRIPVHERLYFTFHNVSINTESVKISFKDFHTLHSIMFLLIPVSSIIS